MNTTSAPANVPAKMITRFAPSPTGLLHAGNFRTALFAYLLARKNGGEFVLRIEDTDRSRSKKEYEDNIIDTMSWLGIAPDTFYRQSEHLSRHTACMHKLIEENKAYISSEEAKDGTGIIKEIVRFKNPNKKVVFHDAIRGDIEMDTTDLGDFVIGKSVDEPLFHLAVVIDDFDEGITHVIRGEDHIPNTPRQILIQEALGFTCPVYAHLPLVLGEDRSKLSKRKGAHPVSYYREKGYVPEALFNFMTFIGFNPGGEKEIYTVAELIDVFDISKIQKGGGIFNQEKMNWINKEHLKMLFVQNHEAVFLEVKSRLPSYDETLLKKMLPLIIERISYYGEIKEREQTDFAYFKKISVYEKEKLGFKNVDVAIIAGHLSHVYTMLKEHNDSLFEVNTLKEMIMPYAIEKGKGEVLSPLRVSLSGQESSADPFTCMYILGKEESLKRIMHAITMLAS